MKILINGVNSEGRNTYVDYTKTEAAKQKIKTPPNQTKTVFLMGLQ